MLSRNGRFFIGKAVGVISLAAVLGLSGCASRLREAQSVNLEETPVQSVRGMFAVQTKDGIVLQRIEADIMQRFDRDTVSIDYFPQGLSVFSYTDKGLLESTIRSDKAIHEVYRNRSRGEKWSAYGNVVIRNVIKEQMMETDTIYWDRKKQEIYTDCYVRLHSKDGLMQGYGMRSDDRARNAILLNPFDSYGYATQDSVTFVVDSVNFIGPLLKN